MQAPRSKTHRRFQRPVRPARKTPDFPCLGRGCATCDQQRIATGRSTARMPHMYTVTSHRPFNDMHSTDPAGWELAWAIRYIPFASPSCPIWLLELSLLFLSHFPTFRHQHPASPSVIPRVSHTPPQTSAGAEPRDPRPLHQPVLTHHPPSTTRTRDAPRSSFPPACPTRRKLLACASSTRRRRSYHPHLAG
jgi:hypothetical protein